MKHLLSVLALLVVSAGAHAAGLPFAVDSLAKAQDVTKADATKHVLIFYSSAN